MQANDPLTAQSRLVNSNTMSGSIQKINTKPWPPAYKLQRSNMSQTPSPGCFYMIHWEHKRKLHYLETPRVSKKESVHYRNYNDCLIRPILQDTSTYATFRISQTVSVTAMVWNLSEDARPPCWWHGQNWFKTYIPPPCHQPPWVFPQ